MRHVLLLTVLLTACGSCRERGRAAVPATNGGSMVKGSASSANACAQDHEPCPGVCNAQGYCEQDQGWGPEIRVPAGSYVVWIRTGRLALGMEENGIITFPSSFWIAKHELSVGLAKKCASCGIESDQPDSAPIQVTRAQAEALCALSGRRLPTNHEWEAAGRGPTLCKDPSQLSPVPKKWAECNNRDFPWGIDNSNFCARALIGDCKTEAPRAVGDHPEGASPLGVQEMIGNVSEWISDTEDEYGMVKGGDWKLPGDSQAFAHVTLIARQRAKPEWKYGVRCIRGPVMNVEPKVQPPKR